MPGGDRTGPAGKGAKTGGQMGSCPGAQPKMRPLDSRGMGIGRGKGPCGLGLGQGFRGGRFGRGIGLGLGRGRGGRG